MPRYLIASMLLLALAACDGTPQSPADVSKAAANADCRNQADGRPQLHGMTTPADMQADKALRKEFIESCMKKKGFAS